MQAWTNFTLIHKIKMGWDGQIAGTEDKKKFLIVVFPSMLTIIQLLFQQNALVFYY
jgi:hypothetical protein